MFHHCLGEFGYKVIFVFRKRNQEEEEEQRSSRRNMGVQVTRHRSAGTQRSVSLGPGLNADLQGAEPEEGAQGCGLNEDSNCARMDSLAPACVS